VLKIAFIIAEIVLFIIILIPKLILKIIEIVLLIVEVALKAASLALNMILCTVLAFMDAEHILDSDNIIVFSRYFQWRGDVLPKPPRDPTRMRYLAFLPRLIKLYFL
jgi:hypothetical protein